MGMSTMNLEVELGRRLREIRRERGLSQQALARVANLSVGAVQHLESGDGATIRTLVRVLRALEQENWIEALRAPAPAFSPLEVLRAQQEASASARRQTRVRRSKA